MDLKENIWRITLLTNPDKCNLRCPLCFLNQRCSPFGLGEMPFDIAKSSVIQFQDTLKEIIPSTMGEPLLYTHFQNLLSLSKEIKVPINLTTNGSFPNFLTVDKIKELLLASSDIKISLMSFSKNTFPELMQGLSLEQWISNVSAYSKIRTELLGANLVPGTLSLQVTLNALNLLDVDSILDFAREKNISRIKWNLPFFLSMVSKDFKKKYGVQKELLVEVKQKILETSKSYSLQVAGNLFRDNTNITKECPFQGELWIYPDGSKSYCPNPEQRFGDVKDLKASCENCPMK